MPRSSIAPLPRSIILGLYGSRGVALIELMLVLGVIAIATTGIVATAKVVSTAQKVDREVGNASAILEGVSTYIATAGDQTYSTLTQPNAVREGLFPTHMLDINGEPKNAWGGDVLLTGATVNGTPGLGAALIFAGVPDRACARFVSAASPGFYAISVNDELVRERAGPIDPARLAVQCGSASNRVSFVYAKPGNLIPPLPTDPTGTPIPCPTQSPSIQEIVDTACPAGQLGTRTFERNFVCNSATGVLMERQGAMLSDTCTPQCILPDPSTQIEVEHRTNYQTLACPSAPSGGGASGGGTSGAIQSGAFTQARSETRTRQRVASCPSSPGFSAPVGPYVWSGMSDWSEWTGEAWGTIASACSAACVLPTPATQTYSDEKPLERVLACPSGQAGLGITQQSALVQTWTRTAYCPQPGLAAVWEPWQATGTVVEAPWSTVSVQCAPVCVAPADQITRITRSAPNQVLAQPCEPGFSGTITYSRSQVQQGATGTYYRCPALVGSYTTQASTHWFDKYTATSNWMMASRSCTTICVAPPPSTEPATRTISVEKKSEPCLNGVDGIMKLERYWVENGTKTTTWTCPRSNSPAQGTDSYSYNGTFGFTPWFIVDYTACEVGQ